jgi:hypothetical protein
MKTAHDIWLYLNLIYGWVSNDDDEATKEVMHECVEHEHKLVIVEIAPPHGQVMMMMTDLPQVHLTRLMMLPQVMQMMMLLHAHLMEIMMDHARMTLLLQAHHYITLLHVIR